MGSVRPEASVLHLDLDAFFASVEQRDKPSLRGKPVVVGGVGQRGVVATASYEARVFGVRSAMPAGEARRRCPHAAFLAGRFGAYREASGQVMARLRALSPLVEPLSLDEAFVDLRAAESVAAFDPGTLQRVVDELRAAVREATGGLTASVGVATSKFMAKIASELAKPDGSRIIPAGDEVELLRPMRVGVIPGVGPVTADKLHRIGVHLVGDLQTVPIDELAQVVGRNHAGALVELAHARDDRPVEPEREAKSISVEDTFERDLVDLDELGVVLRRDARQVAGRLGAAALFARTVTIKVRRHDFSTLTRSRTLLSATDRAEVIGDVAASLLGALDLTEGVRLLGVGVAGLTDVLQEDLFGAELRTAPRFEPRPGSWTGTGRRRRASRRGDRRRGGRPVAGAAPRTELGAGCGRDARPARPGLGVGSRRRPRHRPVRDPGDRTRARPDLPAGRPRAPAAQPLSGPAAAVWTANARLAATTSPRNRPKSSPCSGCHWTPSQNGRSGSSSASMVPSGAWAVGTRPGCSATAWWWWQLTCSSPPTSAWTREPGSVVTETQPNASPPGECSSWPTTSGRCCSSDPPACTAITCSPRQMPSVGTPDAAAWSSRASSQASRSCRGAWVVGSAGWP